MAGEGLLRVCDDYDDDTQTDKIGHEVENGVAHSEHDMKKRDRTFVAFLLAAPITSLPPKFPTRRRASFHDDYIR